jgi:hypothetical protein
MTRIVKAAFVTTLGVLLLAPATAYAKSGVGKSGVGKREVRIVVRKATPKYRGGPNGFLPGYRQPLPIGEWRDRSPRYGGGDFSRDRRYINLYTGRVSYGWGYPRFYRGHWNGGSFGPCWNSTPIGPMWNCGM